MLKGIAKGMREATRLVRSGRLLEATSLIQRTLRRRAANADDAESEGSQPDHRPADDAIEGEFSNLAQPTDAAFTRDESALNADGAPDQSRSSRDLGRDSVLGRARSPDSPVHAPEVVPIVTESPAGRFIAGAYEDRAGARSYKLYIPATYTGQALPLVVMLHGCTQSADDFATGTGMNALAEEGGCFVLYPEQAPSANHSRCWNWFRRDDQARDNGEPAVLAGMTRAVVGRYGIDRRKVNVAGLSAGGAMAAIMASAYPELYAAVGIHSGLACGSAHDVGSALAAMRGRPVSMSRATSPDAPTTPTIIFHGARDKTVHPRNADHLVAQSTERLGASTDASTEQGQVRDGHAYTRTVYRDEAGHTVLEHWLVHEGGHAWFGGSARGSYTDPKGPDATREMLRFFNQSSGRQGPDDST